MPKYYIGAIDIQESAFPTLQAFSYSFTVVMDKTVLGGQVPDYVQYSLCNSLMVHHGMQQQPASYLLIPTFFLLPIFRCRSHMFFMLSTVILTDVNCWEGLSDATYPQPLHVSVL